MKYALLICGEESSWYELDEATQQAEYGKIHAWVEKWQAAGKIADGGAELDSTSKAKTVSRGPDGKPVVTDGPYLELKEVIGGMVILNADDVDEAVAIASGWPTIASFGDKVEVRPIIEA